MYFTFRFFLSFLLIVLLLFSCSEKAKVKSVEDSFFSFISHSPSSILYGKVVLQDFFDNINYKDLPKLNVLLSKEVTTISKGFDLNQPIYYSIDSLFQPNGNPTGIYFFLDVKNKDSLADKMSSLGYIAEPLNNTYQIIGENLYGHIDENIAVLHLSTYASKKTINKALEKSKLKEVNHTKRISNTKNSLSINIHLENLQRLLDSQSLDRTVSKQNELIELYKNSFINVDFQFEQEKLIGDIKFDFNPSLKKRLFFETNAEQNLSLITKNDFVSGLGLSLNSLKLDLFLNDFYPSLLSQLDRYNLSTQMIFMMLGENPISNLTNGNIALAYHNITEPTCFIELGKKAQIIKKISTPYLDNLKLGQLRFDGNNLLNTQLTKNKHFENLIKSKNGLFFIYIAENDKQIRTLNQETKFLDALSTILFTLNNNGGKLEIKGKKQKEGLLYQIANMYLKEIQEVIK